MLIPRCCWWWSSSSSKSSWMDKRETQLRDRREINYPSRKNFIRALTVLSWHFINHYVLTQLFASWRLPHRHYPAVVIETRDTLAAIYPSRQKSPHANSPIIKRASFKDRLTSCRGGGRVPRGPSRRARQFYFCPIYMAPMPGPTNDEGSR